MRHPPPHNTSLAIAQPAPPNIVVLPDHDPEPPPTPPAAAARPGGVSLGAIGKKPTSTGSKQKTYPAVPTSPEIVKLVDFLVEHMPFVDAVDDGKKSLAATVTPFYFEHGTGRAEVESSVLAQGTKDQLLVMFPKQLVGAVDEAVLLPILGDKVHTWFRSKWDISIDGDKIPATVAQALVDGLVTLFSQHGCLDALSKGEKLVPLPEFHLNRHSQLTPAQNLALNSVARIKTSIKIRK